MSPAGPGGRPRNAWESYRNRRLVRLWILTDLTKEEVRKVLQANDFNPSESDIQKRLRSLLPKDYAKDHRTFRPSNNSSMKLRFSRLHRCKDGRVSKYRRCVPVQIRSKLTTSRPPSSMADKFEGPSVAFRNYSKKFTPALTEYLSSVTSPHSQPTISSRLMLDGSSVEYARHLQSGATRVPIREEETIVGPACTVCDEVVEQAPATEKNLPFPCGHACHEACFCKYIQESNLKFCPKCELPLPLRITIETDMLRSNISAAASDNERHYHLKATSANDQTGREPIGPLHEISELETEKYTDTSNSVDGTAHHLHRENHSIIAPRARSDLAPLQAPLQLRASTPHNQEKKSPADLSINSLRRRLSNHSSTSVLYIHSVLRLSSSNSRRSSTSWRSSWMSKSTSGWSKASETSPILSGPLSKGEQDVWNEIIDDSQFLPQPRTQLAYSFAAPFRRDCCPFVLARDTACNICGYSGTHAWASQGHLYWCLLLVGNVNQRDRFGNTPLHYAAASGRATLISILSSIDAGADVHAKNTMGETFMHVLNTEQFGVSPGVLLGVLALEEYVKLLTELETLNFPFSDRDCHGRTIIHVCLDDHRLFKVTIGELPKVERLFRALSNAALILQPDSNAMDNHGYKIGDQVMALRDQMPWTLKSLVQKQVLALVARCRNPVTVNISFRQELAAKDWKADAWLERLKDANLASWIDIHGDTALTAVLKHWKDEERELQLRDIVHQLIDLGIEVNMRDRNGYTALAIATVRGSRPSVAVLLNSGAMPNNRSYRGVSIIAAATTRMLRASKQGKDQCYARIFSCLGLLADYGACPEPTEFEEWLLPTEQTFAACDNFGIS